MKKISVNGNLLLVFGVEPGLAVVSLKFDSNAKPNKFVSYLGEIKGKEQDSVPEGGQKRLLKKEGTGIKSNM